MISVIVPVKNGEGQIETCLRAILDQQGVGQPVEVIVVDDGSTDRTAEIAFALGVRVISQANQGPAAARNTGARVAVGEILAFTDVDCQPSQDWLVELVRPFELPDVVGVKGVYQTRQTEMTARFVQMEYEAKYARLAGQENIDFIDTYSAAYRRTVFLQNEGFDPAFPGPSVEDQEFSFRLARKGYRLVFAPHAVVYHIHDRSWLEYARRKANIGYWKAFMLRWVPEKTFIDSHTLPSQRIQIVLLPVILALLVGMFYSPLLGMAAMLALGVFFGLEGGFLRQIAGTEPRLLPVAVWLLGVRAVSLGGGLAAGILFPPHRAQREGARALRWGESLVKRLIDLVGAGLGLLLAAPVIVLAALAIKLEDGGPVFFLQERAGKNGAPFRIVKLRSMVVGADRRVAEVLKHNPLQGAVFKVPNDPRVTRVGRVLRRWSLDELPQLWNVLVGEMSLVGPRPEETWVAASYSDEERRRLAVKPGLTGPMQVNGRGGLDMQARLALELDYIEHYSLHKDFELLLKTAPAVLFGKGAF